MESFWYFKKPNKINVINIDTLASKFVNVSNTPSPRKVNKSKIIRIVGNNIYFVTAVISPILSLIIFELSFFK